MISFCLISLTLSSADPPTPTAKECVDGFRKNFDSFRSLEVQWKRENSKTDDWVLSQQQAIETFTKKLEGMESTHKDYPALDRQLTAMRQAATYNRSPKAANLVYYTDRNGFQIRSMVCPFGLLGEDPASWEMPPTGPIDLSKPAKLHVYVSVVSYNGNPSDGFRTWTIQTQGIQGWGQIFKSFPSIETNHFPPLGAANRQWVTGGSYPWNASLWDPIDTFFGTADEELTVAGRSKIDGHETIILDKYEWGAMTKPGQVTYGRVIRAFVDPSRGYLPLRIESRNAQLIDGKVQPSPKGAYADQVVEITKIDSVAGAGYYPMKGSHKTFIDDPKWKGDPKVAPPALSEEVNWQVAKVVANQPLGIDFTLSYPKGVNYFDERTGQNVQSGVDPNEGVWLPWTMCVVILSGWGIFGVVMLFHSLIRRSQRCAALARPIKT